VAEEPTPVETAVAVFLARVLEELLATIEDEAAVRRALAELGVEDDVDAVVAYLDAQQAAVQALAASVPELVQELGRADPSYLTIVDNALQAYEAATKLATNSPDLDLPSMPDAGTVLETLLGIAVERTVQAATPAAWAALRSLHLIGPEVDLVTTVQHFLDSPTGFIWQRLQRLRRHLDITITGVLTGPRTVSVVAPPVQPTDTVSVGLRGAVPDADVLLQRVTLRLAADAYDEPRAFVIEVAGHDPGAGGLPEFAAVALTTGALVEKLPLAKGVVLDLAPATNPLGVAVTGWSGDEVLPIATGTPALTVKASPRTAYSFGDPRSIQLLLADPLVDVTVTPTGWGMRLGIQRFEITVSRDIAGPVVAVLLPPDGVQLLGKLVLVADKDGLRAEGGVGLKTTWPDTLRLPGVFVRGLTTEVVTGGPTVTLIAGATVTVDLEVLTVTVEGIGITQAVTVTTDGSGNLGVLDLATPQLKPPTGVGVSIDAGVVKGGGFLRIEPTGMSGALELALILGSVELAIRAVGVLETVDGRVSFVVVLSVEFSPAIELFLGLTLNAVGGVFGINRTLDAPALTATVRSGRMEDVMFPRDLAARATEVIASVKQVFPARAGQVVAGPMLKLGWGRPVSFVTVSVGVVFTFPDPVVIAVIGSVRIGLPAPEVAVVDLRADFSGVIDASTGEVAFDASLTGSRIASFDVTGDLALRAGPSGFIFTAGGFHPGFPVPAGLDDVRRLAISISPAKMLSIRADAYFAVTASTVQFGGGLAVLAELGPIGARGNLNLDVLIRMSPLTFTATLRGSFRLTVKGEEILSAHLDVLLEGPGRWRARARAEIDLWLFSVSGTLELSWGSLDETPPPAVLVAEKVRAALEQPPVWAHVLPASQSGLVVLRDGVDALHPLGRLRVTQTVAPLGVALARFGNAGVLDAGPVEVAVVADLADPRPVDELFAAAQFFDLTDEERLSKPAFVPHRAGYLLEGTAYSLADTLTATVVYETLGEEGRPPAGSRVLDRIDASFLDWSVLGAAGRAHSEHVARPHLREDLGVDPVTYAVVDAATGAVAAAATSGLQAAFAASAKTSVDHVVMADYELAAVR
jgi:hypothetical protein